jgi:hypothetical protein
MGHSVVFGARSRLHIDHAFRDLPLIAYLYCGTEYQSIRMETPVKNILN